MSAMANGASGDCGESGDPRGLRCEIELRRAAFHLRARVSAPPGLTALLGPSGAGKSLTLQAIAGLTPIERGAVTLNGRTLTATQVRVALPPRLRRVGYVPQSYALFPHLSVAANIAYGLPSGLDGAARGQRVAELLRLTRLSGYERRAPRDLSGGEAQRVALARALAAQPDALLLDEPFSALDAPTRSAVRSDLREIALASGLPTLLVTHDLSEALALASRLALLAQGRVIAEGTVEDVTARPASALAARLLGWGALLPIVQQERVEGGACVTLRCGQRLLLGQAECAEEALASAESAGALLALRPERLAVERIENAVPTSDEADSLDNLKELQGVITCVSEAGRLWSAQVTLAGAPDQPDTPAAAEANPPLEVAFSPREWQALGLAQGAAVRLRLRAGAARLVAAP